MIASYMDESFDMRQSGMFVVGGLMGRGIAIFELDRRWESLRKRPDIGIQYFKASQCERGTKEFAKFVANPGAIQPTERDRLSSISREFLSLIVNPPDLVVFGVGINQDEFYRVVQDAYPRQVLGKDPYRLAYDLAMILCAASMRNMETKGGPRERVSFVCDETEQYGKTAERAYASLKEKNPRAGAYMATYTKGDEKDIDPLQAADAVVYEIRRVLQLALGQRKGPLREQFKMLNDAKAVFAIADVKKQGLMEMVAANKPGEPFNLDVLMDCHLFLNDVSLSIP